MLKVDMYIAQQMNHKYGLSGNTDSSGVALKTILSDDDDHPPSSWRTETCALMCGILPAWNRKAD
jgi:hypothetical protein